MSVCVRLTLPLVVSLSNHEPNRSSFRLRQGYGGPPKREARRLVDRLRTSVCARRLPHFMRQEPP